MIPLHAIWEHVCSIAKTIGACHSFQLYVKLQGIYVDILKLKKLSTIYPTKLVCDWDTSENIAKTSF